MSHIFSLLFYSGVNMVSENMNYLLYMAIVEIDILSRINFATGHFGNCHNMQHTHMQYNV